MIGAHVFGETAGLVDSSAMGSNDQQRPAGTEPPPSQLSPGIKILAIAEFVVGVGALAVMGETNPLYYLLVVGVAAVVVALVASDQRRRSRAEARAASRERTFDALAMPDQPATAVAAPASATAAAPSALRSDREEFVAALVEYGMRIGVRTITRAERDEWATAQRIEYDLLRAASCCAENERAVVGELVMWDAVSVLHLLDTPSDAGDGIARSVVAPYGRLPAATRVPVRRDPARFTCEVATLALDPRVANEYALNLLWRGIYDHARRGGATEVVWTLAGDLATLWRDHFGFPLEIIGDRRATSSTVTAVIPLPELETKLLRERPAYFGWLTVGFVEAERVALGLPIDLSGAYARVCDHVMAARASVTETLALQ